MKRLLLAILLASVIPSEVEGSPARSSGGDPSTSLGMARTAAAAGAKHAREWRVAHEHAIVDELTRFLSIPNVATNLADMDRNADALSAMLRKRGLEPRLLRIEGAPALVVADLRRDGATRTIVAAARETDPVVLPSLGGSVPMYVFQRDGTPVIGVPIVNHDNRQHAADENLRLQNLWDGIEVYAALMAAL